MVESRPLAQNGQHPGNLADRWFYALDRRRIVTGMRSWIMHVTGIHLDGREVWIQIAPGRTRDRGLVLHASEWTTIDQAIAAVTAGPPEGDHYPRVICALPTM